MGDAERENDRLRRALELIRDGDATLWPDCSARKLAAEALAHGSQNSSVTAGTEPTCADPTATGRIPDYLGASGAEYQALVRVAEAAEQQAERIPPVSYGRHGCGCESGGGTTDLEPGFTCGMHAAHDVLLDALAELHRARDGKDGGSDAT